MASTLLNTAAFLQTAAGQRNAGIAAQQESEFRSKQMETIAGQERAASQRQSIEKRREATVAQSKARAIAAASGGGALDPSVVKIMGDLEGEGEFNALSSLYEGEERARNQESEAIVTRYEGQQKKKAGYIAARSTILKGSADTIDSMSSKYG